MKNKRFNLIIVFLFFILSLFIGNNKTSYGIYRNVLNTKVYLSVLDPSTTFTVSFDSNGGSNVAPIVRTLNSEIGTLPIPTKTNYNFVGWYTQDGNTKIDYSTRVTENITYYAHWEKIVCKKATTLHTETCYKSDVDSNTPGCRNAGYAQNSTITYGTIPGTNSPLPGDAYTCDVNNDDDYDETTERFYFIRENDNSSNGGADNAVLIHYTNFDENGQTDNSTSRKIYSYDAGKAYLPDSTLWTNGSLASFDGKVSRYPTQTDLEAACGVLSTTEGYLDACQYFLETSRFQSNALGRSAIWIEKENNKSYRIDTRTRKVNIAESTSTSAVRPVIEIPYNTIEGYHERESYTVTFNSLGGSSVPHIVRFENQKIGTLPRPTKENYTFGGWYIDTTYAEEIDADTLVTGNVTYYAKWNEVTDNLQMVFYVPGSCTFNGSKTAENTTNITSNSAQGCISTINPSGDDIDYTTEKFIDTGISLFSTENFDKDFEIGFYVDSYVADSTVDNQATLVNSKVENSSKNYPGFVVRRNSSNIELTQKFGSSTSYGTSFTYTSGMQIKISRQNGIIYYAQDDGDWQFVQDINAFTDKFNLTTWFGAYSSESNLNSTGENSTPIRYFKGTLSNMYIKLEQEEVVSKTATFNAHGGNASYASKEVTQGKAIGTLPTVTKSGYYFAGWYTEETGGRKIDETEKIIRDITFHAQYKDIFLVTFDANGGTLSITPNTVEVVDGETISSLPTATLTDYIFDGWYTNNNTPIDGSEPITGDTTYHAEYLVPHTVTFDGDGATPSFESKVVGHGKAIGELPTVEKSGYSFAGWYTDNTYTTPVDPSTTLITKNETFIAKWQLANVTARVNNQEYETLQEAINAVPNDKTKTVVTLLKDVTLTSKVTISSTKNIEFDLQNYTISGSSSALLDNSGTIEIKNGTISSTGSVNTYNAINNKSSGVVNITGGTISSTGTNAIVNVGTINITGGRINCSAQAAAINNNTGGILTISAGEIITTNTTKGQTIYNDGGTLTISGTTYLESKSTNRGAVHNNAGTTTITGGTIIGKGYSAVLNNDTMTIGTDDGTIDITTPVLQGNTYGLEINSDKTVTVHDGIFKGKTRGINDTSRTTHNTGTDFDTTGTETIGSLSYKTAYLYSSVATHTVTFNSNGGSNVASKTVASGDSIGTLPKTEKSGTKFLGWFTSLTGGNRINSTTEVTEDVTYYAHFTHSNIVCERATNSNLHTYNNVTFGQVQSGPTLKSGDAYNCDVNGDGTYDNATERFYYLTDDQNGNAVMIYYNNTSQASGNDGAPKCKADAVAYPTTAPESGPVTAASELPTTSQWSNVNIYTEPRQILNENGTTTVGSKNVGTFLYEGRAARLATIQEIKAATTSGLNGTANELQNYTFLLENTASYGDCRSNYWLETPKESGGIFRIDGSGKKMGNVSSGSSGVRPVIEVPYDSIETQDEIVMFDIMPTAMRTYFDNINTWAAGQTDSNHSAYDTAMTNNLNTNNCVYFKNDGRDTEYLSTYCDQPNKYDTGVNGPVKVYRYDPETKTASTLATYVTSNQGKLYNMIPNEIYYWESDADSSINGYVKAIGERRIISIDNVLMQDNTATSSTIHKMRNVRDLGGLDVTYQDSNNQTITGKIKYSKLFRGEKIWGGDGNTIQYFTKLGITNEMDLRAKSEKNSAASTEDNLSHKIVGPSPETDTFEIIHYGIDYNGYVDKDGVNRNYYSLARNALKEVMTEFVTAHNNGDDDYALFFHCRIGADRTGTLAYLLEGILGVSEEDRYRDYELTVFFGLRERTRFYYEKTSTNDKIKFVHLKQAIRDAGDGINEDVLAWYLKGSENQNADMALVQQFRSIMIDTD